MSSCLPSVVVLAWCGYVTMETCIQNLKLSTPPRPSLQGLLFVSSNSGLVEVPVANCSNYLSCGECVLSRDPYCAWTGWVCQDVRMAPPDR